MAGQGAPSGRRTPLSPKTLIVRYAAFAVLAILANLGAQRAVLAAGPESAGIALALAAGTGVGLVVKYLLDKRWIFFDRATGVAAHSRRFSRYTATGVLTTLIFWGAETGFWAIWHTHFMREAGAVLGLTVGYVIKYRLDRRFVFSASA